MLECTAADLFSHTSCSCGPGTNQDLMGQSTDAFRQRLWADMKPLLLEFLDFFFSQHSFALPRVRIFLDLSYRQHGTKGSRTGIFPRVWSKGRRFLLAQSWSFSRLFSKLLHHRRPRRCRLHQAFCLCAARCAPPPASRRALAAVGYHGRIVEFQVAVVGLLIVPECLDA